MSDDPNDMQTVQSHEPMDRLTELCARMTVPLDEPENDDVRAIVFLNDHERGGIQFHGYEDTTKGLADLFVHMQAVFAANGKTLDFIGIPDSPKGLN